MVTRVQLEPAFLLHQRPFRNTSQIIDVITANHGVVSLVCRGARRPTAKYRGLLQPFALLRLSWNMRGEMGTLNHAESGAPVNYLQTRQSLAGFYLNELTLRLVPKGEYNPEVFSCYSQTILSLTGDESIARALRLYEFRLLKSLGYAPSLDVDAESGAPVQVDHLYRFEPELGPVATRDGRESVLGQHLLSLSREDLRDESSLEAARRILGPALRVRIGDRPLRSSAVIKEVLHAD